MAITFTGSSFKKYEQGEYVFTIRQFAPFYAIRVLGELQKIISPILGGMSTGADGISLDDQVASVKVISQLVSGAANNLAQQMNGEKLENVAKLLLDKDYVSVAPKGTKDYQRLDEDVINEIFAGRIIDMIALMIQVVKVNYLDFSKLCSVPTGIREALAGLRQSFQVPSPTISEE